jgi:hypothetical protein
VSCDDTACPQPVVEGLVFLQASYGFLVDGGPRTELFTGRAALELIPRLVPLLDGTRQVKEIAAALDVVPGDVLRAVELMRERGLLDVASASAVGHSGSSPMRVFLRRSLPGGRGEPVYQRLQGSRVCVAGTARLADVLADMLRQSGVGAVDRIADVMAEFCAPNPGDAADLVICVRADGESGLPVYDSAWPLAVPATHPWLRVRAGHDNVSVGPLFNVAGGPCAQCFSAVGLDSAGPHAEPCLDDDGKAAQIGLGAAIAAGAALRYVGGYGTSWAWHGAIEVSLIDGQQHHRAAPRRPDCPECGLLQITLDDDAQAELDYELAADSPPWGGDLQPIDRDTHIQIGPSKRFLLAPRLRKRRQGTAGQRPRPADMTAAGQRVEPWRTAPLLLERCVGALWPADYSDTQAVPRWAPCAGNLGTTRAYILGDVDGSGPGAYYFDGASNEFVVLPFSAGAAHLSPSRGIRVALAGDVAAATRRLGLAGRRVAYLDVGLAVAQFYLFGNAAGWRIHAHRDRARDLCLAFELNPSRESVVAVVDAQPEPATPGPRSHVNGAAGEGAPDAAVRQLSQLVRRHPMTYKFDSTPVDADVLVHLMESCLLSVDAIWRRGQNSGPPTECVLYARNVRDLPCGFYLSAGSGLQPLLPRPDTALIETYLLGRHLDLPALLLLTGDLVAALAAYGADGYRALAVQSSAAANLARLAAAAADLQAGLFTRLPAALLSGSARDRSDRRRVFYGCAVGHGPAELSSYPERGVTW